MHALVLQMRKEMEAGQWRGMDKQKLAEEQAAQQGSTKVAPKPYMSAQFKEDTMRTTGQPSPPRPHSSITKPSAVHAFKAL